MVKTIGRSYIDNHSFSFRNDFADQWYDLHNPEQTDHPMTVVFKTERDQFPPNVDRLTTATVLLYFGGADLVIPDGYLVTLGRTDAAGARTEVRLKMEKAVKTGVVFMNVDPVAQWELSLPNTVEIRNLFKKEFVDDLLFIVTYEARLPQWPS